VTLADPRDRRARRTAAFLRCGVAAGPLFVGTFLVDGATRPDYDPLRHPVSSLALGPHGWTQTANFAIAGVLYLGFAAGLRRGPRAVAATRVGPLLIGAAAVGLLGSATFTTDPVSGYPPGTPDAAVASTPAGALHDLFSVPIFLGLPVAALAFARGAWKRRDRRWAACSASSGLAMLATFVLAGAAFNQVPGLVDIGGLLQRASIVTGFGWLTALAVRTLKLSGEDFAAS
jgi:Protein of unknown function (DUF998)